MADWGSVKDDTYYWARIVEERARREQTPALWREYADIMASKGSYALAVHGYMSRAVLLEQQGEPDRAMELYARAFDNASKTGNKELAMIVAYRHALLAERVQSWETCIDVYEQLGNLCERLGHYFLAADAYEHAAGIMARIGRDVSSYAKPIELWQLNATYWRERGQEDDAAWSDKHIELYRRLFGVQ